MSGCVMRFIKSSPGWGMYASGSASITMSVFLGAGLTGALAVAGCFLVIGGCAYGLINRKAINRR